VTAFANIYKCTSEDGIVMFSDTPCGTEAELAFYQPVADIDEALGVPIEPFLTPAHYNSHDEYITDQAKRVGRVILTDQWFNYSKLTHVHGPSLNDSRIPKKAKSIYGSIPGWVILLYYGPPNDPRKWSIEFRYDSKVRRDINGISKSVVLLRSIAIEKDGLPFTPDSMKDVNKFNQIKVGFWKSTY